MAAMIARICPWCNRAMELMRHYWLCPKCGCKQWDQYDEKFTPHDKAKQDQPPLTVATWHAVDGLP
jgi:phage terminase large subunit GpA-like protein